MPPVDIIEVADKVKRTSYRLKNSGDVDNYLLGLQTCRKIRRQKALHKAKNLADLFLTEIDKKYVQTFPIGITSHDFVASGYEDGTNGADDDSGTYNTEDGSDEDAGSNDVSGNTGLMASDDSADDSGDEGTGSIMNEEESSSYNDTDESGNSFTDDYNSGNNIDDSDDDTEDSDDAESGTNEDTEDTGDESDTSEDNAYNAEDNSDQESGNPDDEQSDDDESGYGFVNSDDMADEDASEDNNSDNNSGGIDDDQTDGTDDNSNNTGESDDDNSSLTAKDNSSDETDDSDGSDDSGDGSGSDDSTPNPDDDSGNADNANTPQDDGDYDRQPASTDDVSARIDSINPDDLRNTMPKDFAQTLLNYYSTSRDMAATYGDEATVGALQQRSDTYAHVIGENEKTLGDIQQYSGEGQHDSNIAKVWSGVEMLGGPAALAQKTIAIIPGEGRIMNEFIDKGANFTNSVINYASQRSADNTPEMSDKSFEKFTAILKESASIGGDSDLKAGFGVLKETTGLVNNLKEEGKTPEAVVNTLKILAERAGGKIKDGLNFMSDVGSAVLKTKEGIKHYGQADDLGDNIQQQAEQATGLVNNLNDHLVQQRNDITIAQGYIQNGKISYPDKMIEKLLQAFPDLDTSAYKQRFEEMSQSVEHQQKLAGGNK